MNPGMNPGPNSGTNPESRPTKVKLSGAVMAHPKRLAEARQLAEADPLGRILVTTDPDPAGRPTALRTAPVSWGCVAPDATHHLVLQDDVELAEGFYEHAEQVAAAVPGEAVAFYAGWEARNGAVARLAALTGAPWAYTLQEHVPCQALMLPAELARGYAEFQAGDDEGWPYDVVMQRYLNARGVPVRFCTPSTVQHAELPSLAGNASHGHRQATLYTGRSDIPDAPDTDGCPRFPVVPFYQYGDARCAVRRGSDWEFVQTERYLRRTGLLERCFDAYAAAQHGTLPALPQLPERVGRAVWLTGFAIGAVTADRPEPDPAVATAVMDTLGPGGLCEEHNADELIQLAHPIRDLALVALAAGRAAGPVAGYPAEPPSGPRVAVTGGDPRFRAQLAGLLADHGHRTDPPADADLDGVRSVVHLGSPAAGPDALEAVLAAAEKAGADRLVYAGSAAVYRGSGAGAVPESALTGPPADPVALAWWREEERCRQWGEQSGIAVQVLRLADPIGPHAPDSTPVRWVDLVWTRHPLTLRPQGVHQVLDYRDLAGAIAAVLAAPEAPAVLNVASAAYSEDELAELVAQVARRTTWERAEEPATERWTMATGLITDELGWRPSASVFEGMRTLAQWYACDIHGDYVAP
ncbi:NAD-dependent epimerase/dehydratase family protein [Kitasatospora aureofaciens]|uniref:NAD-dependent epimerase/dehydratase family protein n=1 Tax=Kitasatospora aureofaciens TaxID=1894 RepID=UPI00380F074A